MKIAFDENLGLLTVKVFRELSESDEIKDADIVSARDYSMPHEKNDDPWIIRFADAGGDVIISGDINIRRIPQERAAIADTDLICIFLSKQWGKLDNNSKTAMLIQWWPEIEKTVLKSKLGQCWEIPCSWNRSELKDVTGPAHHYAKARKKKKERKKGRSD